MKSLIQSVLHVLRWTHIDVYAISFWRRCFIAVSLIGVPVAIVGLAFVQPIPISACRADEQTLYSTACGFDFSTRMNELSCIRQGVNPFNILSSQTNLPPFYACGKEKLSQEEYAPVIVYTPLAYSYMYVLSCLPRAGAWYVYLLLLVLSLVFVTVFAYRHGGNGVRFQFHRPQADRLQKVSCG